MHLDTTAELRPLRVGWRLTVRMRHYRGRDWPVVSRRLYLFRASALSRALSWSPIHLDVRERRGRVGL